MVGRSGGLLRAAKREGVCGLRPPAAAHHVRKRHGHLGEGHAGADVADGVEQRHLQGNQAGKGAAQGQACLRVAGPA